MHGGGDGNERSGAARLRGAEPRFLARLRGIAARLTGGEGVDRTLGDMLAIVDGLVPLRAAVLVLEEQTGVTVRSWRSDAVNPKTSDVLAGEAFQEYVRMRPGSVLKRRVTHATLQVPARARCPGGESENFPLRVDETRLVGVLHIHPVRDLEIADRFFLETVASIASIALDRLRERAGRDAGLITDRTQRELLALVSHDLRNLSASCASTWTCSTRPIPRTWPAACAP